MPTDSAKLREFVREPLKSADGVYKDIDTVAGVGPKAAEILKELGFGKAFNLVGHFMTLNMDEELFVSWLSDNVSSMNSSHRKDCYTCVKEWCDQNL